MRFQWNGKWITVFAYFTVCLLIYFLKTTSVTWDLKNA